MMISQVYFTALGDQNVDQNEFKSRTDIDPLLRLEARICVLALSQL